MTASVTDPFGEAQVLVEKEAAYQALRSSNRELQRQLLNAKHRSEDLVEATIKGAREAMLTHGPLAPVPEPAKDRRRRGGEAAIWHLTDWQGRKLTASYNGEVMRERVLRFCDKAATLTEIQRADHPVARCVILFGGDMGEGLFNFPTQPFEIDASLFEQFTDVASLEAEVVRRALAIYEHVEVIAEWGNHGRIGSKRSAVPRSDNFDRMTYELAKHLVGEHARLTWRECPDDIQRVEVGEYRALLIHGDEIGRNGFASPMTMVNHVAKWQSGAYPWAFRDCYVGHYHVHQEFGLPNGLGSVYYSGSTESDNRYARDTMASSAVPSQRLNFVDPRAGRVTAVYKVWVNE